MSVKIAGYQIKEKLFESNNSIVYRAKGKQDVLIKILNDDFPKPTQIARFRYEYELMNKIDSAYIPNAHELINDKNHWGIVMEDIGVQGDLELMLSGKTEFSLALEIAIQITEGLLDINKVGIVHKDIKPQNIIFNTKKKRLQIIDFGMATELSFEEQSLSDF